MLDKIFDFLKQPGYIEKVETRTARLEISKEEILQLIKEGKIRVRKDGYVEVVNREVKDLNQDQYTIKED